MDCTHGFHPRPTARYWVSSLATPKISKQPDLLLLNCFPFPTPLADLVTPRPAAVSQLYRLAFTRKLMSRLPLILGEMIFTLFQDTTEVPGKTPEALLARGRWGP